MSEYDRGYQAGIAASAHKMCFLCREDEEKRWRRETNSYTHILRGKVDKSHYVLEPCRATHLWALLDTADSKQAPLFVIGENGKMVDEVAT